MKKYILIWAIIVIVLIIISIVGVVIFKEKNNEAGQVINKDMIEHPECYEGGGVWNNGCISSCKDICADILGNHFACDWAGTPCCDCGPNKCWDGEKCISGKAMFE